MGLASFQRARREALAKLEAVKTAPVVPSKKSDSEIANDLYRNISKINADEVRFLAKYLKVEYSTKEETIVAIKNQVGK